MRRNTARTHRAPRGVPNRSRALASIASGGGSSQRSSEASRAPQLARSSARGARSASTISGGVKGARLRCAPSLQTAVTDAWFYSPGATLPLVRGRTRDSLRLQSTHARGRIEERSADEAGVDDDPDTLDGQAGLGDIGCKNHFAHPGCSGSQGNLLIITRQLTEQRQYADARIESGRFEQRLNPPNFACSGRNTSTSPCSSLSARPIVRATSDSGVSCCPGSERGGSKGAPSPTNRDSTGNMRP